MVEIRIMRNAATGHALRLPGGAVWGTPVGTATPTPTPTPTAVAATGFKLALNSSSGLVNVGVPYSITADPPGSTFGTGKTANITLNTIVGTLSANPTVLSGTSPGTGTWTPTAEGGPGTLTATVAGLVDRSTLSARTFTATAATVTPTPTPVTSGGTGDANFAMAYATGYDEPQSGTGAIGRNYMAFGPGQVGHGNAVSLVKGTTRIPVQLDLPTDPWPGGWRRGALAAVQLPGTLPGYTGTPDVETVGTTGYTIQDDGVPYTGADRPICTEAQFRAALASQDIFVKVYGADLGADELRVSALDVMNNGILYGVVDDAPQQWRQTKRGEVVCEWNVRACFKRTDGAYHKYMMADVYISAFGPTGPFEVTGEVLSPWMRGAHAAGTVGRDVPTGHPTIAHFCEVYRGSTILLAKGGPNDPWAQTVPVTALDMTRGMLRPEMLEILQRYTVPYQGGSSSQFYINARPPIVIRGSSLPGGIVQDKVYWAIVEEFSYINYGGMLANHRYWMWETQNVWEPNTNYGASGDPVYQTVKRNGITWYRCTQSGVSGTTGPTGGGTNIVDGTARWESVTAPITSQGSGSMTVIPCAFTGLGAGYELCDHFGHPAWSGPGKAPWVLPKMDHEQITSKARLIPHLSESTRPQIGFEKSALTSQRTAPGHSTQCYDWNAGGDDPMDEDIGPLTNTGASMVMSPWDRTLSQRGFCQAANSIENGFHLYDGTSGGTAVPNSGPDRAGGRYPGMAPTRPSLQAIRNGQPSDHGGFLGEQSVPLYDRSPYLARYATIDSTHLANWYMPTLLMSGRTLDLTRLARHTSVTWSGTIGPYEVTIAGEKLSRPSTVVAFPGTNGEMNQLRGLAWATRDVGYFEHLMPAAWGENALAKDIAKDSARFGKLYMDRMKADYPTYFERGLVQQSAGWQQNYYLMNLLMHARRGLHPEWLEFATYHAKMQLGLADRDSGGHEAMAPYLSALSNIDPALGPTEWEQARASLADSIAATAGADWLARIPATGFMDYQEFGGPANRQPDSVFNPDNYNQGSDGLVKTRSVAALAASLGLDIGKRVYNRITDRLIEAGYSTVPVVARKNVSFRGNHNLVYPRWHHDPEGGFVYVPKTPTSLPDAIGILNLGVATDTTQVLSWVQPRGAVTSYVVRRRVGTGAYTEVAAGNVLSYTATGLATGTLYEWQVAAVNSAAPGDGRGSWSPAVSKVAVSPVASFAGVPAGPVLVGDSVSGISVTFAGFPRAFAALFIGGAQQGARVKVTAGTPLPALGCNVSGQADIRVFDASSNGNLIATSSTFAVNELVVADGPYRYTLLQAGFPAGERDYRMRLEVRRASDNAVITPSNLPSPGWVPRFGHGTSSTNLPLPTQTDTYGNVVPSFNNAEYTGGSWFLGLYFEVFKPGVTYYPSVKTSDGLSARVFGGNPFSRA